MDSEHIVMMNMIAALAGMGLCSWLLNDILTMTGGSESAKLNKSGLIFGILGAVILMAVLHFFGFNP